MKKSLIERVRATVQAQKKAVKMLTESELIEKGIEMSMKKANRNKLKYIYLHLPKQCTLDWLKREGFDVEKSSINGSEHSYIISW